jgi:RND family efflux transporter MFP subunit
LPNQSYSASTIAGYQTSLGAARTEVITAIGNLTTAKNTYDSASASATTAANSAGGGVQSSIAVGQAEVQEALGALDSAKAALEKTIIRSPISGTIIDLPVTSGNYVSSASEIAEVSNPSALKVVAYVTPDDAQTLAAGNAATINGNIAGVITQIAPAINPQTGAIEVDVGLSDSNAKLIDGDSVTVDFTRTASTAVASSSDTSSTIIPIVALKITPDGPVVFTFDAKSRTIVSHPVSIGSILGQNIVVTQGLTPSMVIVTDARGLTSGENVSVKKPQS